MNVSSATTASAAAGVNQTEIMQKMFDRIDHDGDGKITQEEFSESMQKRFEKAGHPSAGKPDAAAVFESVDSDQDGAINLAEFKTAMDTLREQHRAQPSGGAGGSGPAQRGGPPPGGMGGAGGPPSAEAAAEEVFDELDTNKDGTVSIEELMASLVEDSEASGGTEDSLAAGQRADLEKLFKAVDADNDGSISKTELTTVFTEMRKRADEERARQVAYQTDGTPRMPPAVGENLSTSV